MQVEPDTSLVFVRLGEWDTTTQRDCDDSFTTGKLCVDNHVDVGIETKLVHPSYNKKKSHHDLALLRLARAIINSDFINPICLPMKPSERNANLNGISLIVAGMDGDQFLMLNTLAVLSFRMGKHREKNAKHEKAEA